MKENHILKPFVFTLFGASGNLAKIKLFPSFYQLAFFGYLPDEYYIFGYSRTEKTEKEFKKEFADAVRANEKVVDEKVLSKLIEHVYYFHGQYDDLARFTEFHDYVHEVSKGGDIEHTSYFSVPPSVYENIITNLVSVHEHDRERVRLIIEKPFGNDEESAEDLYHFVSSHFEEEQIFLLDHYLGKTAVQSILQLRHSNRFLNLMMRGSEIANIQITAFEDYGIGERAGYFDNTGIIRDMVQSHLLQSLALVTMSIPLRQSAESIQRERNSVLSAVYSPLHEHDIVIGQYSSYHTEKDVPENSSTETFAALRLKIDRDTWHNVPLYLRTGKKLCEKHTFVVVEFKKFEYQSDDDEPNRFVIELQPEERISLKLLNKIGPEEIYQEVTTTDSIACSVEDGCLKDHTSLILSAMRGERTYFLSFPEVISTWKITDAIIQTIQDKKIPLEIYEDGSCGPDSQSNVTNRDNFKWYDVHLPKQI
jgi:glucose-6-phosphate 1-dehydrogenase